LCYLAEEDLQLAKTTPGKGEQAVEIEV